MGKYKIREEDMDRIREYQLLSMAEYDPDIILDADEAYEDWLKCQDLPEEEMRKRWGLDEQKNILEWTKEDFREYYEAIKGGMGDDVAWNFLYAKILERAGEGNGGISPDELFGEGWDNDDMSE